MAAWKPIEEIDFDHPIWVLKYDIFFKNDGNFCDADHPEAVKFTSCHGYYGSEEEAEEVRRHFPNPVKYRTEKVHKRILLRNKPDPYSCAVCNGAPDGTPGYARCTQTACPYKGD